MRIRIENCEQNFSDVELDYIVMFIKETLNKFKNELLKDDYIVLRKSKAIIEQGDIQTKLTFQVTTQKQGEVLKAINFKIDRLKD